MRPKQDETKLPKWAQNMLMVLQSDLRLAQKAQAEVEGHGETDMFIYDPVRGNRPLPKNTSILFAIAPTERITVDIKDAARGRWLDISGYDGELEIRSRASNRLLVRMVRFGKDT